MRSSARVGIEPGDHMTLHILSDRSLNVRCTITFHAKISCIFFSIPYFRPFPGQISSRHVHYDHSFAVLFNTPAHNCGVFPGMAAKSA